MGAIDTDRLRSFMVDELGKLSQEARTYAVLAHGAYSWEDHQLIQFGNDEKNLIPVEPSLNSEKGASGPDRWLPPIDKCAYFEIFEKIRKRYHLVLSNDENKLFQLIARVCER